MLETIVGILGTAFLGAIGFIYNAASRLTVIETQKEDYTNLLNQRFDEIARRLDRIERSMNGHLLKD